MLSLIVLVILETKFCNLCLAAWACLPSDLRTLIASDMYIFSREELAHFCKDILKELHGLLFADAKYIIRNTPVAPNLIRTACTSELRISSKSSQHMSRQVNLRNYGNSF